MNYKIDLKIIQLTADREEEMGIMKESFRDKERENEKDQLMSESRKETVDRIIQNYKDRDPRVCNSKQRVAT